MLKLTAPTSEIVRQKLGDDGLAEDDSALSVELEMLKFRDADPGFKTSPVMIKNVGPGVAYRVNWRFLAAGDSNMQNQVYELGSLAVGQEVDGGRGGDTYITCNFYGPTSVGNRGYDNRSNLCSAVGSSQGGDGGNVR